MRMLRKGWSINKSLSSVMMQEAFAEIANSRNLSSLGTRQAVTNIPTSIKAPLEKMNFLK